MADTKRYSEVEAPFESELPSEDELATLGGANGPGVTAWVQGVKRPCGRCGHAKIRHGEAGGARCGFLGCACASFRPTFAAPEGGPRDA